MQKKLIALALAGLASSAAFAQTNVTIYGVADATFDGIKVSGTNRSPNLVGQFVNGVFVPAVGSSTGDIGTYTRVSANSSLLGFRGEEALGNGLKAIFQYETAVGFDAAGGFGATRDSFAGLNGGFGTVKLGNMTGPTRALGQAVDVFTGATGIGTNSALLGKLGNRLVNGNDLNSNIIGPNANAATCGRSQTCASLFDTRWKNSIAYVSPNFSGFTGTAVYVANENKTSDFTNHNPANGLNERNTYGYDVGLNYNNGPIMVGLTYNAASFGTTNITPEDRAHVIRLAGKYDFGVFSIVGLYEQTKLELNGLGSNELKQNVWGAGGTWNITPSGRLVAQYYRAGDVSGNGALDQGGYLASLGYEYSLSKRTMVRAIYSRLSSDRDVAYDFGVNATGSGAQGGVYQGIQVGLRHNF